MRSLLEATPFILLLIMLGTAWRVLVVLGDGLVPARIHRIEPDLAGPGGALLLVTQDTDGTPRQERLDVATLRGLAVGQRVTLRRGPRPGLARWSFPMLVVAILGGIVAIWLALYLPRL